MIFLRWCIGYQHIGFDEFKQELQPVQIKPDKEVFEDVEKILESMR